MKSLLFFGLFTLVLIFLFATERGREITRWMEKEKLIVAGVVGVIVFTFQSYVMIMEYFAYLPYLPILCFGVLSVPLAVGSFVFTLKTMWDHGYRPIWYSRNPK
jgi:hypothetical protein